MPSNDSRNSKGTKDGALKNPRGNFGGDLKNPREDFGGGGRSSLKSNKLQPVRKIASL